MEQYCIILEKIKEKYKLKEGTKINIELLNKISRTENIAIKDLCCILQIEQKSLYLLNKGKRKYTKLKFNRYEKFEDMELIKRGKINKEIFKSTKEKNKIKNFTLIKKLGISSYMYYKMQRDEISEIQVIDIDIKHKVDLIRIDLKYLNKRRSAYYTKEDLEKICKDRGISLDQFLQYYSKNKKQYRLNEVALEKSKKGLWIGENIKMPDEFFKKNVTKLNQGLKQVANKVNKIIRCYQYKEDLIQDTIIKMYSECGNIVKKFYFDSKLLFNVLMVKAKYMMINIYRKNYRNNYEFNCFDIY